MSGSQSEGGRRSGMPRPGSDITCSPPLLLRSDSANAWSAHSPGRENLRRLAKEGRPRSGCSGFADLAIRVRHGRPAGRVG
jgi:hypothetical protein